MKYIKDKKSKNRVEVRKNRISYLVKSSGCVINVYLNNVGNILNSLLTLL